MAVNKLHVALARDYTWEFEGAQGEDKQKSVLKYKDDYDGWIARCPLYGSAHPDLTGFYLVGLKAAREPGDQIAVTCLYEANSWTSAYPGRPAGSAATARYAVRVNGRDEHILSNEFASGLAESELKALYAISNGNETDEAGKKWESLVTSADGLAILAKIRKGNVAYKTGGVIYIERKLVNALSSLRFTNLYKIDTPPGGVGGVTNGWLYLGGDLEPSPDGTTWQAEFQWEYSPDGWDADLYS